MTSVSGACDVAGERALQRDTGKHLHSHCESLWVCVWADMSQLPVSAALVLLIPRASSSSAAAAGDGDHARDHDSAVIQLHKWRHNRRLTTNLIQPLTDCRGVNCEKWTGGQHRDPKGRSPRPERPKAGMGFLGGSSQPLPSARGSGSAVTSQRDLGQSLGRWKVFSCILEASDGIS